MLSLSISRLLLAAARASSKLWQEKKKKIRSQLSQQLSEQAKAGSSSSRENQLAGLEKSVPGAGVRQCQRSLRMDFGESNVGT